MMAALISLAALALAATAPSFNCTKASGVEAAICAEPRLAALNVRLAALYRQSLRSAPAEAEATRRAQVTWLRNRDETCSKLSPTAPCLDGYYRNRIQQLELQQSLRDETAGHAPASTNYADFVGRWQVVAVTAAEDAGEVTNFTTNDPQYVGLVLSARADGVRWLNGLKNTVPIDVCAAPSFVPRRAKAPLPFGWKAVTLVCKGSGYWTRVPAPLTLKAQDLAEMDWDEGASFHLKRMAADAKMPPPPHMEKEPPLPPGADGRHVTASDKSFFRALQVAVRRHDRQWLVAQGDVQVNRRGGLSRDDGASYDYKPGEVLDAYDWIITPDVEQAVLAQDPDTLFSNYRGVMVGNGAVWFTQIASGGRWVYAITAINQAAQERRSH